ncbi:hypothetical protein [Acinetobacter pittii]|uniref:hypothetical protein n=1 Tax=Acinetobacter pittii TaxID=48296 RepID=UPI000993E05F|nr:hypothetical protein [Acinetobacter pittii]MCZ1176800.1 hypothetical protein [Acinetobacter pittii]OOT53134.1 hypothetical protein BTG92_08845 [Acinetobacter pittii]OTU65091.1 hypothetical protein CAT31_16780 [Acinetobacter pittii]
MNKPVTESEVKDPNYNTIEVPEAEYDQGEIPEFISAKAEKIPSKGRYSVKVSQSRVESPYLPPEYLEGYERIEPGMGKKLMEVIIEHQQFQMEIKRNEMELNRQSFAESIKVNAANIREQDELNKARNREIDIKSRGQIFAFIISVLILSAAILFAVLGHTILAGTCVGIMVAMASVLFLQKAPAHERAVDESAKTENEEK